jgi:primosomal replication protein N
MTNQGLNRLTLTATMVERDMLRYTPAGIPVLDARISHASCQNEAAVAREVGFEMAVVFAGKLAETASLMPVGQDLELSGFLAARRKLSKSLVMHVTECCPCESNERTEPNEV